MITYYFPTVQARQEMRIPQQEETVDGKSSDDVISEL